MSIVSKLKSLKVEPTAMVTLTYSEGTDVFVHNETEIEEALAETDVVQVFSSLVATPRLSVYTNYGDHILSELRDAGHLDEYVRGSFEFEDFVSEVVSENIYDFDFIDRSVEKYDHKRGFCTLTAEVQIQAANLMEVNPYISPNWKVSFATENGILSLSA
tara:strand:- start:112 stop:591 length:480 start_codon:yes stop_codon:yes gene_type:complete